MKHMTINRQNWTGKTGTVDWLNDGRFLIEDIPGVFKLEEKTLEDEDGEIGKVYIVTDPEGFTYKGYSFVSLHTKQPHVTFEDMGIVREHTNPFAAFAELAWNIF